MFLMSSPKLLLKILTGTEYIYTAFQGQQRALFSSPSLEKHESESRSVMSNSLQTHGLYSPWNSLGQNTGGGSFSLLQGNLPNPGIKPGSPALQVDSLLAEPQGKPKDTGVGSLSLLQRVFPIQESNRGLLHCRQIKHGGC